MFGLKKNRNHPFVGRRFRTPDRTIEIEIVAYNSDKKWWFCIPNTKDTAEYIEYRNVAKLTKVETLMIERKECI